MKTSQDIKKELSGKPPRVYHIVEAHQYADGLIGIFGTKELAIFHIEEMILFLGVNTGGDVPGLVESLKYLYTK